MRINLIGKFTNPSATEHAVKESLINLGHEVRAWHTGLDVDKLNRSVAQILPEISDHNDADVCLFMKGDGVPNDAIGFLKGVKVCWYPELLPSGPGSVDSLGSAKFSQLLQNVSSFDILVLHNPSEINFVSEKLRERGINIPITSCMFGPHVGRERDGGPLADRPYGIGFAGYPTPRRIAAIQKLQSDGHIVYLPTNWIEGESLKGEAYFDFISKCQAVLNIHCTDAPNIETRVFEAMGCRTLLITDKLPTYPMPHPSDCYVVDFGSPDIGNQVADIDLTTPVGIAMNQRKVDNCYQHAWQNSLQSRCAELLDKMANITENRRSVDKVETDAPSPDGQQPTPESSIPFQYAVGLIAPQLENPDLQRSLVTGLKAKRVNLSFKSRYKVGLVGIWFERGQSYVVRAMAKALKQQFDVHIFARAGQVHGIDKPAESTGKWDMPNVFRYPTYQINPNDLINWVKQNDIDVVIFNEEYDFGLPACLRGIASVVTYLDFFTPNWLIPLNIYDLVICATKRAFNMVKEHVNVQYVDWIFDHVGLRGYFSTDQKKPIYHFTHNAGWLGINYRKGTPTVIEAFYELWKKQSNLTMAIYSQCGPEKLPQQTLDTLNKIPQSNLSIIQDDLSADLLRPYQEGHVYVYPSRLDGLGLTMPEALYCRRPVVATNYSPMSEWINETNGELVPVSKLVNRNDNIAFPEAEVTAADTAAAMERALIKVSKHGYQFEKQNHTLFAGELCRMIGEVIAWNR